MNFFSEATEKYRILVTMSELRLAVRRMEELNEVDVFYSAKGELIIQSAHSVNYHLPPESKFGSYKMRPPKLRKYDLFEAGKTKERS